MSLNEIQLAEIEDARSTTRQTRRPTVEAMEEILLQAFPVLDHGFVRLIDYMGDDSAIVQAARVSYGRGTRKVNEDRGLINYLLRHRHTTPFEMCEIKLHVKLPLFVARQWIRHRTANVNEYSARYSILSNEFYVPAPEQLAVQSSTNRQGRGNTLNPQQAEEVRKLLIMDATHAYEQYRYLLNENDEGEPVDPGRDGLARELARMELSLNFYTEWYWKVDLHNLMHFLGLRADSHAQYEIRVYAEVILEIMNRWVPFAHQAFVEHHLEAVTFSGNAKRLVRALAHTAADAVMPELSRKFGESGLTKREWNEVMDTLELPQWKV
jgi:thymidylate synthase (FAD)